MRPGAANEVLLEKLKVSLELKDTFQRAAAWQRLILEMRPEDAMAVQTIFDERTNEGHHDGEYDSFLHHWGMIDGDTAANAISDNPESRYRIDAVMSGWGRKDEEQAIRWLKSRATEDVAYSMALSGIFEGLSSINPEAAELFLQAHAGDAQVETLMGNAAASRVRQEGLSAAGLWFAKVAEGSSPDPYKSANLGTLLESTGRLDHKSLGHKVMELLQPYQNQPWFPAVAGNSLGERWGMKDPAGGMKEISKMTAPEAQKKPPLRSRESGRKPTRRP